MKLQELEKLGERILMAIWPWVLLWMAFFVSISAVIGLTISITKGCK